MPEPIEFDAPASASRGGTPRRLAVAALALGVATGGTYVGWRSFTSSAAPLAAPSPSPGDGYFIDLPAEVEYLDDGSGRIVATTNLPEGTRLIVWGEQYGPDGTVVSEGGTSGQPLHDGRVVLTPVDGSCYSTLGNRGTGSGYRMIIRVRPSSDVPSHGPGPVFGPSSGPRPSPPPYQPASVRAILGDHFERLTGPQVTTEGNDRVMIVSRRYTWPADLDRCGWARDTFSPKKCPQSVEQVSGNDLDYAMRDVAAQLSQGRLCDLWDWSLTEAAEAAHPYAQFREEWDQWLTSLGNLGGGHAGEGNDLAWRDLGVVGARHELELTLRGRAIARLTFVQLTFPPPNVVPQWGIDDYTLIPGTGLGSARRR